MKMKCDEKKDQQNKGGKCDRENCNPFMPCVYGNFYTIEKEYNLHSKFDPTREKMAAINDNRLASRIEDFWHPPEL